MLKILILFLVTVPAAFASTQEDIELLKKRIDQLEKKEFSSFQNALEPKPSVSSYLNDNLTFGGFFESSLTGITGPDTDSQASNSSNYLGINLSADLGSKYRFVGQYVNLLGVPLQNQHNDPNSGSLPNKREFGSFVPIGFMTQGYIEYNFSRMFNLRGGLGFVPFGFTPQLREPVLYVRRGGPQLVRNSGLISPLWNGIHLHGSKQLSGSTTGYDLYTFAPALYTRTLGVGGRVWLSNEDDQITGGLSTQVARNEEGSYQVLGGDLRFDYFPYQVRTEFAQLLSDESDTLSGYIEPGYFIYGEEVLLYVFGDYLYGANNKTGTGSSATPDPIQKWEYGAGVNWLPNSLTRFRLGVTINDYIGYRAKVEGQDRDFVSLDLSVGVAF